MRTVTTLELSHATGVAKKKKKKKPHKKPNLWIWEGQTQHQGQRTEGGNEGGGQDGGERCEDCVRGWGGQDQKPGGLEC